MKSTQFLSALVVVTIGLTPALTLAGNAADYDTAFNAPVGHTTWILDDNQIVTDVITDSAGNIFVAGYNQTTEGSSGYRPFVMKFLPSGAPDLVFGSSGFYQIPFDHPFDFVNSNVDIGLASDGKIYISFPGGNDGVPYFSWDFALVRILADGSGLDTTFGNQGRAVAAFDLVGTDILGEDYPEDLVVQSDGKIVVVGWVETTTYGNRDFGIARFTTTGSRDTTFDTDGKVVTAIDLGYDNNDTPYGVAMGSSGEIIVVGSAETAAGGTVFAVTVLTTSGVLDSDFSTDGKATFAYEDIAGGLEAANNEAFAVTTYQTIVRDAGPDTILVGGRSYDPTITDPTYDMAILCLDMSGDPCTVFGNGGWNLIDFSDNGPSGIGDTNDFVAHVLYQPLTGTVTVVGPAQQVNGDWFTYNAVARVDALTGALDSTFGSGGTSYYLEVERTYKYVVGALDPWNRIIIASMEDNSGTTGDDIWVGRLGTALETPLFSDGFESGDFWGWDDVQP
jgi:uncharacterized delta-60 repeat protein